MNNTPRMTVTDYGLSVDEILKSIYAESAWRALRSKNGKRPAIINRDNKSVLIEMLTDGYVYLCSQLLGYIKSYDFDSVRCGIITLSIATPCEQSPIIQQQLERFLACHLLSRCYNTEDYEQIGVEYNKEMKAVINSLRCSLLDKSYCNI